MTEALSIKIDQYGNGEIDRSTLLKGLAVAEVAEVEAQLQLVEDIKIAAELSEVRAQISGIVSDKKPKGRVVRFNDIYKLISVAAAVLVAFFFYSNFKNSTHPLIEEYANIKEGLPSLMGETNKLRFDEAMTYFKQEDYKTAIQKFTAIDKGSSGIGSDTLDFYIGVSQFHMQDYKSAIALLRTIDAESNYRPKAIWYLLMSYVALDEKAQADKHLELILSNPDHPYIDRARAFQQSWADY